MERLDGGSALPPHLVGGIVALGNFDGSHRGHQAVAGRAIAAARAAGRPAIVATFDPHPVRLFKPDAPPIRLTPLDQRERLFGAAGADAMLVFHFDAALAALTAEEFVAQRLVAMAQVGGVVTGEDFTFGKAKGGNVAILAELGRQQGITVETVGPVSLAGRTVSSSRIRDKLVAGERRSGDLPFLPALRIEPVLAPGADARSRRRRDRRLCRSHLPDARTIGVDRRQA